MGLTRLAVERPIMVVASLLAVLLFGLYSYAGLGLDLLPEVKTPAVIIQVVYAGAGPEDVEQQVTRKVEDALSALSGIEELTSISSQSLATVTVKFREGVNIDFEALEVERAIDNARRNLPAGSEPAIIRKVDLNDTPIVWLALTSTGARSASDLYRVADDFIRPRLEGLDGIAAARVLGGRKPEIQVEVGPEALRAHGLSIEHVAQALASQYQSVAGGLVKQGRAASERELGLRVQGREPTLAAVREVWITNRDGQKVQLGTIAEVSDRGADQAARVRLNGREAIGIVVSKQIRANITQSGDRVFDEVDALNAELPPDLRLEIGVDRTKFVRDAVADVERELAAAVGLTGLVLLLFLHTIRATIIVVLAIPTCIIVSFIAMQLSGLSLNIMSLLGLTTSIGILVDDSIVVLENIVRKIEDGRDPKTAAIEGRAEIGLAAIAITIVDVVVYGPMLFLSGWTGGFMRNFAIVVTAATLTSLLVSFTVTPLLASRWIQLRDKRSLIERLAGCWEPGYRGLERGYARLLGWCLRHRLLPLLAAPALLVASFALLPLLGTEFVPPIDDQNAIVKGEMPGGTGLAATDQIARRWENLLLDRERFPEIKQVFLIVGAGPTELDTGARFLASAATLVVKGERTRVSGQVERAALDAGNEIPELQASTGRNQPGKIGQAIQVRLYGSDQRELARWAAEAERRLARRPELTDLTNGTAIISPEIVVHPDPRRMQDLGLSTQQVGNAVRTAYEGVVPARYPRADGSEVDIRLRLPEATRYSPERVRELPLLTADGQLVALGQVAELEDRSIPTRITRFGRARVANLGAEPLGVPLGTATEVVTRELSGIPWPAGVRWELGGQSKEQDQSFRQLGFGLVASIVLIYLVLTMLYDSLVLPLVVLSALPLALIGAIGGLLVFGETLNIMSLIGVMALFGLVGKNSILLVDYTNQLRRRGLSREAALCQACPRRLRPILMTSATLVFGLLPVALRLGEGGELRAPLAVVIMGGMVSSTLLTLVFVPVSYTLFDDLRVRLSGGPGPSYAPSLAATDSPNGKAHLGRPEEATEPRPAGPPRGVARVVRSSRGGP